MLLHACPCPQVPHGVHGRAINAGSSNVSINGKPAARVGDAINCGGSVAAGSGDVFIGDTPYKGETFDCGKDSAQEKATYLKITPLAEAADAVWTCPPFIPEALTKKAKGEAPGVEVKSQGDTLDAIGDGRAVAGHSGFLQSKPLTRKKLQAYKAEMKTIGVDVVIVKNGDKTLPQNVRGGFDWAKKAIYLRKGVTEYEAFHEATHAKQFVDIGKDAYVKLGRYARESHGFKNIFKNRHKFTYEERRHALEYMRALKEQYQFGRINSERLKLISEEKAIQLAVEKLYSEGIEYIEDTAKAIYRNRKLPVGAEKKGWVI
ncbi:PAAR motif protein [Vibrio quintilis]|uniref:PAAR motif protein n=1 Tax=Vibrio quintilis TaxID=1117707 RepID=A0A1M7Z1T9_9VIBR|nr:PAAR motif protein [Vibrio quintilis]